MAKFNLKDLMSERSTQNIPKKQEIVYRNPEELIPSEDNFYKVEDVETIKQSMLLVGILQPLTIEKTAEGDVVIAGHRRRKACLELINEGNEEFKRVPCIYRIPTEEDDQEEILRQIALIQANNYRDKSDWERMTETLQMEELVKELRKKMSLEGKTRDILKDMINVSSGQVARYHAINNNLTRQLLEEFKIGSINVSVAYEASTLDAERQQMACRIFEQAGILTLGDVQSLKTLMNSDIPGQMRVEEILPEFISADVQIERFYESLKKNLKQRIKDRDQNMTSYLLYTFYGDVKIQNRFQNYQGSREGIIFNPGENETLIPWKELAERLINRHGKKEKPVKIIPVDAPGWEPDEPEEKTEEPVRSAEKPEQHTAEQMDSEDKMNWPMILRDLPVPSLNDTEEYLKKEEQLLKDYIACGGLPEKTILKQQIKVAGLRMVRSLWDK